jgi:hypothetical protein
MDPTQVVVLRWVQVYRELLDEMVIWSRHTLSERRPALKHVHDHLRHELANRPEAVLANLMLPAISAASTAVVRGDQRIAMLRVVEAVRLYAASHEGKLPASLDEISEVPVPFDPATGRAFGYRLEGNTGVLTSADRQVVRPDTRFEITIKE